MEFRLAGHRWSVVTLILTALVVLAAEVTARPPAVTGGSPAIPRAPVELEAFLSPLNPNREAVTPAPRLVRDPLEPGRRSAPAVASSGGVSTVRPTGRPSHVLTAVLVADGRPIAVVNDVVVGVGDRLPDGARIEAIRGDRVTIVTRSGQRSVLTLTAGRQQ